MTPSNKIEDGYYYRIIRETNPIETGMGFMDYSFNLYNVLYENDKITHVEKIERGVFSQSPTPTFIVANLKLMLEDVEGKEVLTMEQVNEHLPEEKKIRPS